MEAHTWSLTHSRKSRVQYAYTTAEGPEHKRVHLLLHRMILQAPPGKLVDHINANGLDNRRDNLRLCTHAQNMRNRGPTQVTKSGFKGVRRADTVSERYKAQIKSDNMLLYLGYFGTVEEAARAYDRAAIRLHGEFAYTNFPREDYE